MRSSFAATGRRSTYSCDPRSQGHPCRLSSGPSRQRGRILLVGSEGGEPCVARRSHGDAGEAAGRAADRTRVIGGHCVHRGIAGGRCGTDELVGDRVLVTPPGLTPLCFGDLHWRAFESRLNAHPQYIATIEVTSPLSKLQTCSSTTSAPSSAAFADVCPRMGWGKMESPSAPCQRRWDGHAAACPCDLGCGAGAPLDGCRRSSSAQFECQEEAARGLRVAAFGLSRRRSTGGPSPMLHAGLDLSRKRLDVQVVDGGGTTVEVGGVVARP